MEYNAFRNCKNLKNINLPGHLEYIGKWCFLESGIESVRLPGSLRTVAQAAFECCGSLKTATFCDGLEVLGTDECPGDGTTWRGVFHGSALENIELPTTLKRIEYSAFQDCKNLKNIRLPDKLEYIGKRCFCGSGLKDVVLPTSLRTVAQSAFAKCESLKTVKLNEGLEVLGTN